MCNKRETQQLSQRIFKESLGLTLKTCTLQNQKILIKQMMFQKILITQVKSRSCKLFKLPINLKGIEAVTKILPNKQKNKKIKAHGQLVLIQNFRDVQRRANFSIPQILPKKLQIQKEHSQIPPMTSQTPCGVIVLPNHKKSSTK